jgi:hypothetical protein
VYNVEFEEIFLKKASQLTKKYPSLPADLQDAVNALKENPFHGESLGGGLYKVRLHIKSKRVGKSGGGRLIIHVIQVEEKILFLSIYDKSETESEDLNYLKGIAKNYWDSRK